MKHVFYVLCLLLNLVEELYFQNCKTNELEILLEERYSLQVGLPQISYVNNVVYQ